MPQGFDADGRVPARAHRKMRARGKGGRASPDNGDAAGLLAWWHPHPGSHILLRAAFGGDVWLGAPSSPLSGGIGVPSPQAFDAIQTIAADQVEQASPIAVSVSASSAVASSAAASSVAASSAVAVPAWVISPPRGRVSVRLSRLAAFLGPAFVVSVAYVDPGNFATNLSAGSNFSYGLVWVVLWSNLMAIFLQTLSAKLGIATGKTLPQLCTEQFSSAANWFLWGVAELAAMATNVAEFLGGALGFYLLFHIPLVWAGLLTGVCSLIIIGLDRYGQKAVEWAITALVGVISLSYVLEIFLAGPDWGQVALHTLVPSLGRDSILVAVGMLGATVMPHVIFLHSQLVLSRRDASGGLAGLRRHLRMEKIDVAVAMNVAFLINASMVVVAAAVFHTRGMSVTSIEQAHMSLAPLLGAFSGTAFAIALLASGLSSSAVGTMAGQCVMQGFGRVRLGPFWERLLAMIPAMGIIASGFDPVRSLILSQVSLSFALPFAIIPLLIITGRRRVMGPFTNTRLTSVAGCVVAGAIIGINLLLLYLTIFA